MVDVNKEKYEQFSLKYLKSRLSYDSETGIFTWKFKNSINRHDKRFNTIFGGKVAGGCKSSNGYLQIQIDGKLICAHRIAYLFMTGEWPDDEIDHINGNRLDNRWENLRAVSREENFKNKKIAKNNTSGVMGVHKDKNLNKWIVQINVSGKKKNLGKFDDFFEAICRRKSAELEYHYHSNHGTKR